MAIFPEHFPGEKLIMKIWETITEKGITGLLSPWQIRRKGRARAEVRRHEALLGEQTKLELDEIRSGRKRLDNRGRLLTVRNPNTPSIANAGTDESEDLSAGIRALLTHSLQEGSLREAYRILTLRQIAIYAEEVAEATPDEAVSDDPIDPDWFARWRRNAEDTTDDLLKRLWARVLAGEVKQPKTYSFRTLDFLRNLSSDEAHLIQEIAPIVLDNHFIYDDDDILPRLGLSYDTFIRLEELGILTPSASGVRLKSERSDRFSCTLLCHNKGLVAEATGESRRFDVYSVHTGLIVDGTNEELRLNSHVLSTVGRQVITLGKFEANVDYLRTAGENLKAKGFNVYLGDTRDEQGKIYIDNPIKI